MDFFHKPIGTGAGLAFNATCAALIIAGFAFLEAHCPAGSKDPGAPTNDDTFSSLTCEGVFALPCLALPDPAPGDARDCPPGSAWNGSDGRDRPCGRSVLSELVGRLLR
jgi:hypothetical protein